MARNRDEEIRKYEGDVYYDAWRRGLNPDRAVDCARDCYWDGCQPEECVDGFAAKERRKRQAAQEQEQFPEEGS